MDQDLQRLMNSINNPVRDIERQLTITHTSETDSFHHIPRPSKNKSIPLLSADGNCYLQTLLVRLLGPHENSCIVRVLLDSGSHKTLVRKDVVDKLQLTTEKSVNSRVEGVGGKLATLSGLKTTLEMRSIRTPLVIGYIVAELTKHICSPLINIPSHWISKRLSETDIYISDCTDAEEAVHLPISVLLGASVIDRLILDRKKLSKNLSAIKTTFGWCITGAESVNDTSTCLSVINSEEENQTQVIDLSRFWIAEGWSDPTDEEAAAAAIEEVSNSLKLINNRYFVNLVWIDKENLNDNYKVASCRIRRWVEYLHSSGKYDEYEKALKSLVENDYAEPVPHPNFSNAYFVPHRGVWKESSETTKLRIVYDCSSHSKGAHSLNDKLSKGVDLNPLIQDMLLKFRVGKYGLVADLKQAFLQIRLFEEERNYVQFLWVDRNDNILTFRMTSVPFGATCSPFLLAVTLKYHIESFYEKYPVAHVLRNRFYVDDFILTANNEQDIILIRDQAESLFKECSMILHKWRCSSLVLDKE